MLSLLSVILFVAIWMTAFEVFTGKCESHTHGQRPLRFTGGDGDTRNERDDRQPLDPSAFGLDDETVIDGPLELDKPRECFLNIIYGRIRNLLLNLPDLSVCQMHDFIAVQSLRRRGKYGRM